MEVTRVDRAYIKIAVLRGRNSLCDFDLIPKIKKPVRGRRFVTREDITNAVRQQRASTSHEADIMTQNTEQGTNTQRAAADYMITDKTEQKAGFPKTSVFIPGSKDCVTIL
ncbi:hypothetical protein TNCV_393631 [Trichonephila clavipes]|nr:hypothetical protein TNCV_393631 [Trichonephila clavipes]